MRPRSSRGGSEEEPGADVVRREGERRMREGRMEGRTRGKEGPEGGRSDK